MPKRLQLGTAGHAYPSWLRAIGLFCVVLFSVLSGVQVAHVHGEFLPHHTAQLGAPADASQIPEDSCPLCMAMHTALPAIASVTPVILCVDQFKQDIFVDRVPTIDWHFPTFSRPPPPAKSI